MAYPPYNSHLNWIFDPVPPPTRDYGDITSPAPSGDHSIQPSGKENVPPQDVLRKLPRKMRPRRRKGGQPGTSTNHNSPAWNAGRETQREPTANQNSASREAAREMRPGSTTNYNSPPWMPGSQPGTSRSPGSTMRAPVKHPLTIQPPHLTQPPMLSTNHNSERRFDPTSLNLAAYINRPVPASKRIQPLDLVETPSPDLASPHLLFSDLIETPSLDLPLGT